MSRPIKFRVWNKNTNKYEYTELYYYFVIDQRIKAYEYEQYTGLKDKNGKEIYEGDIVYDAFTGDEVFIVGWDKDKASFMLTDTADYPMAYFDEYELNKDLEVIGNVHENPELIGGEE